MPDFREEEEHMDTTAARGPWEEGGFVRDTLIYRLGLLAQVVVSRAFSDPRVQATYAAWRRAVHQAEGQASSLPEATLVESGCAHGGQLWLEARRHQDEFLLLCKHAQFQVAVCIGFDTERRHISGLYVAHFRGDPLRALAWVRDITRHTALARPPANASRACKRLHQSADWLN